MGVRTNLVIVAMSCLLLSCACVPTFGEKSLNQDQKEEPVPASDLEPGRSRERRGLSPTEQQEALLIHQLLRAGEGASNMNYLYWDDTLADYAREWAESCVWGHGQPGRTDATWSNDYIGQNLYFHTSDYSLEHAIGEWYREKDNYDYDAKTCTSGICGHYTQVAWANTEKVGCAKAECSNLVHLGSGNSIGHAYHLVCNYGPGGNYPGAYIFKKGASCTECDGNVFWCDDGLCRDCAAEGITDQCECADGCVHGTPDPSSCSCQDCDPGWVGDTCNEPCQNLHASCGVTRGWKEKHCTGRNAATIQLYCPLMCGLCGTPAEIVPPPTVTPAPSNPGSVTINVPLYSTEEATELGDTRGSLEWTYPPYAPEDGKESTAPCNVRGVMKLTPPTWARAVQLKFTIQKAMGWVYNLADTNCQENWGMSCPGGAGTHSAEFAQHGQTIIGFRSGAQGKFFSAMESGRNMIVTIRINRFFLGFAKGEEIMYNQCGDFGYVFDEMWLGINRVVSDSEGLPERADRVGSGMCDLEVTWQEDEYVQCDNQNKVLSNLDLLSKLLSGLLQ